MNSRERILAAVNHVEPDRVPVDLGSTPSSGISAIAYHQLNQHLGNRSAQTRIYDTVQELALPEKHILDLFGVDVIDIGRILIEDPAFWYEFQLTDEIKAWYPKWFQPQKKPGGWEVYKDVLLIARKPDGASFFDGTYFPYVEGYPANFRHLDTDMARILWAAMPVTPWHAVSDKGFWQNLRKRIVEYRQESDKAFVLGVGCNLFEWGTFLRRMDNFLMDVYADPVQVERLLDALMERHLETLDRVCTHLGDLVDFIKFGDDLGMDSGPFMAPEIYRKLFKPRHQELCKYAVRHSDMIPFLHSCGSIYQLMPDLIEAGFKVFNPVQTNATDMEPERLKKEFGSDICFWGGGIDTRTILNYGTPEQIRDQVRKRLDIFMPGGGYVFNTVHNILPDVPAENIIAMFEAVLSYKSA